MVMCIWGTTSDSYSQWVLDLTSTLLNMLIHITTLQIPIHILQEHMLVVTSHSSTRYAGFGRENRGEMSEQERNFVKETKKWVNFNVGSGRLSCQHWKPKVAKHTIQNDDAEESLYEADSNERLF